MSRFEKIDDYETIINYLFNNTGGYDNEYAIYERNRAVPDMFNVIDISSMSACDFCPSLEKGKSTEMK